MARRERMGCDVVRPLPTSSYLGGHYCVGVIPAPLVATTTSEMNRYSYISSPGLSASLLPTRRGTTPRSVPEGLRRSSSSPSGGRGEGGG